MNFSTLQNLEQKDKVNGKVGEKKIRKVKNTSRNLKIKILRKHFFYTWASIKVDYRHFQTYKDSKIFTSYPLSQEITRTYVHHNRRLKEKN